MKVLITGGTGLLGYALQQAAPSSTQLTSIYHPDESLPAYPSKAIDLTDHAALNKLFGAISPDVVIHTAAQGSVDWCEENPDQAHAINVDGTKHIASLAEKGNAHFIFTSSNAVYDGAKGNYQENDSVNPLNVYGQTKVAVEQWLSTTKLSYTVLRPNLMYGWPAPGGRDNQVTRTIKALRAAEEVNGVSDTFFSPLATRLATQAIWQIAEDRIPGTFNLGGNERLTLYELSSIVAEVFELDASLIKNISVNDSPAIAKRAIDTSFDNTALKQQLNIEPKSVTEELAWMKQHEPVTNPV